MTPADDEDATVEGSVDATVDGRGVDIVVDIAIDRIQGSKESVEMINGGGGQLVEEDQSTSSGGE